MTILKNIRENNLDESRSFVRIGDLFKPFGDMRFDFIAANPPYIPAGRALPASVVDYEPAQALYAGADALISSVASRQSYHSTSWKTARRGLSATAHMRRSRVRSLRTKVSLP